MSMWSTPFELSVAALEGWSGYLSGLCRRRADILDVATDFAEFWSAVSARQRPQWTLPNRIVGQWTLADLRDFSRTGETLQVSTLILPPQSGRASTIVDFGNRSQLATMLESGLTNVHCVEWHGDTHETTELTIEDYLTLLDGVVEYLGGRVNLVGYSQGGVLATIFAALRPGRVNSLVLAGTPIDFHAGRPFLRWIDHLQPGDCADSLQSVVAATWNVLRELGQATGIPSRPAGDVERALGLLAHIDDPDYVANYRDAKRWFDWTQDIPVRFRNWMISELFVSNRLMTGELVIDGRAVVLETITCPLFLIAGRADQIVPAEQLWALERLVSTPRSQITRRTADCGHLGLAVDRAVLQEHWLPVMRAVAEVSAVDKLSTTRRGVTG